MKAETGKGYFFFPDKVHRQQPPMYHDLGLECKASQLCTEITLHADHDHTYTCVLLSLNLYNWDRLKENPERIQWATIMLDAVAEDFIQKGKNIRGLEKAVRFTEKSRALGMGALGFHSYLQSKMVAIESLTAHMMNIEIFKTIKEEAVKATKWMAEHWGEPEWCRGYGVRNTHLLAVAPNMSSALLMGGVSQGIEPFVANVFNQNSAAGEVERVNPEFLKLMKERNKYSESTIQSIIDNKGSVQHFDWLTEDEKLVFKTAFEIDQKTIIRLASARQKYICQAQSLNLFFDADEEESYISEVHKTAFLDENIKSLYYMRTLAGVQASKECVACEG